MSTFLSPWFLLLVGANVAWQNSLMNSEASDSFKTILKGCWLVSELLFRMDFSDLLAACKLKMIISFKFHVMMLAKCATRNIIWIEYYALM